MRAAGQYHPSENNILALAYTHVKSEPFEGDSPDSTENRIYQQFTLKHNWGRPALEHRFRLEQRWIEELGETDYRNRFRYGLQVTTPLKGERVTPGKPLS